MILAFTATNVIAHGVPYLALIWIYGHNQIAMEGPRSSYISPWISKLFSWKMVPFYIAVLFVLAFLEEAFLGMDLFFGESMERFLEFLIPCQLSEAIKR